MLTRRSKVARHVGTLSLALAAGLMMDGAVGAQTAATFPLRGIVRDFKRTDPNIAVAPVGGNGQYAGNIDLILPSSDRPAFVGGGYKVAKQWRDQDGHNIAPHMYVDSSMATAGVIRLAQATSSPKHGVVDTYNSTLGPYGGSNVGPAPEYEIGVPMPSVNIPAALQALPNQGDISFSGASAIASDIHCNRLNGSGTMSISGNVNILCEDVLALATHATISLQPGATLTMYLKSGASSWNHTVVGDPLKPGRIRVYNLGTADFMIHNHAEIHAHIVCPNGVMELSNHGALYGQYTGKTIKYDNHGDFHVDNSTPTDACGNEFHDVAGAKGVSSSGGIPSAAAFDLWYADVMGTNLSMPHTVTLTRDSSGTIWQYISNGFHPIDKALFGNQSQGHNNYFTWTCSVKFRHHACDERFLEFSGNDDVWVFIEDEMVMDRGGVLPGALSQHLDMNRMDLDDGEIYNLHFFYAQRTALQSIFKLRTNLELIDEPVVLTASAAFD